MNKAINEMYEQVVRGNLFEGSTVVHGDKTYIVTAMCVTAENEDPSPQDFSVQASSPGQAKTGAMLISKEMGHKSCQVTGIDLVPDSGQELQNLGSGEDLGRDSNATDGQVKPSDLSKDLPDAGV